jgi:hypothetical protein
VGWAHCASQGTATVAAGKQGATFGARRGSALLEMAVTRKEDLLNKRTFMAGKMWLEDRCAALCWVVLTGLGGAGLGPRRTIAESAHMLCWSCSAETEDPGALKLCRSPPRVRPDLHVLSGCEAMSASPSA